ncbi:MAG: SDR family NAD(P)-dependent oxidoreductase [Armatimonadetes bacterium]|nr:SDR family NAD(P)-dependent oxidoreductase [Armatimonadota bacterium]
MPSTFKRAVIVGASSGIGEALARRLAQDGCCVALVARRADALCALADRLNSEVKASVACAYPHDVRDIAAVPALFAEIARDLGGLDLIVYAAGVMPRIGPDEFPTAVDADTVATNFTGAVAWLNEAAQRFGKARSGTIVGISSVSGDRGRRKNTVYGATKAALNVYLESLYNQLAVRGVAVVNIKPGPIDTPMTRGLKLPLMIPAEQAAREILEAARAGTPIAYVPAKWKLVMTVLRAIPAPLFKYLSV